jgi:hypothetical protein
MSFMKARRDTPPPAALGSPTLDGLKSGLQSLHDHCVTTLNAAWTRSPTAVSVGDRGRWARLAVIRVCVVAAGASGLLATAFAPSASAALPAGCQETGSTVTCSYGYTGSEQSSVVPLNVTNLQVAVTGGTGGSSGRATGSGGRGAQISGTLAVVPGETLYLEVGGDGGNGPTFASTEAAGGFNGGGAAGAGDETDAGGSGGGGASDIRSESASMGGSLNSRLVLAAGGGGAPGSYSQLAAGGDAGAAGTGYYSGTYGGGAATVSAAGTGGDLGQLGGGSTGARGSGGSGGTETGDSGGGGGGGGGGVYGGGGGSAGGGGGGGASLAPTGFTAGLDSTATPQIVLSYEAPAV